MARKIKMKKFKIDYTILVSNSVVIEAKNREEAKKEFDRRADADELSLNGDGEFEFQDIEELKE